MSADPNKEQRSPIKNLPVRQPGQSIREHTENAFDSRILPWILAVGFVVVHALQEWAQSIWPARPMPWFYTALATVVALLAFVRIRKTGRRLKAEQLGRVGEEAVGQYLEEKLRHMGCQVLHDIPGDGFNIDHVVIGTTGIYMIETKTHSKPLRGNHRVVYDGKQVTVNGFTPDRDPITQARANANSLRCLIEESTGKRFTIQPVVLYPGWFVDSSADWPDIWVMNEKLFPVTIARQRPQIDDADVHLVTYHLKRYVIGRNKEERRSA